MHIEQKKEKKKVVLDTNIIVSAALSNKGAPAKVFELLVNDLIENYTSREIILEIIEVFDRPIFKRQIKDIDIEKIIYSYLELSNIISYFEDANIHVRDKDDLKILSCALFADAIVITGDKDLTSLNNKYNIKIVTPQEFLREHYEEI